MPMTPDNLGHWATKQFKGRRLILVANRGPVLESPINDLKGPAGGLQAALTPVMRACGGTWISTDVSGTFTTPRSSPMRMGSPTPIQDYSVLIPRRVYNRYYNGFSNSGLWPLCHQTFIRPQFNSLDWSAYEKTNSIMANAIAAKITDENDLVFIQDYHFCLLPKMLRELQPNLNIAFFWHIPWPSSEVFATCPWATQLLSGISASDFLGFQIQQYCNNFMETIDRSLECCIDRERNAVIRNNTRTLVRANPISIDTGLADLYLTEGWEKKAEQFLNGEGIPRLPLIVGVDRADYTKGIPEKILALESLLDDYPSLKGRFHFVQVATPTRVGNPQFDSALARIRQLSIRINTKHSMTDWKPMTLIDRHISHQEVHYLYRLALACVVSSLHDGMNLVAKEFVASRSDEQGVLVLSKFTGAAREFAHEALLFNPFDLASQTASLMDAFGMCQLEQKIRMSEMRSHILENNIYNWAINMLSQFPIRKNTVDFAYAKGSHRNPMDRLSATSNHFNFIDGSTKNECN